MFRKMFSKFFSKMTKNRNVSMVQDSVTMGPGEYRHVHQPVTATERTIQRIKDFNAQR